MPPSSHATCVVTTACLSPCLPAHTKLPHYSGTEPVTCPAAGVALLQSKAGLDLQHAMLLVPLCWTLSGIAFFGAEAVMTSEQQRAREAVRAAARGGGKSL